MSDSFGADAPPSPSLEPAPGELLPADTAAGLDRDAAHWPELALSPPALSALELRLLLPGLDLGELWLPSPDPASVVPGTRLALRDPEGVLLGALTVRRTEDEKVTGDLLGVRLPAHPDAAGLRLSPEALAAELRSRGWRRTHGLVTDRPLFDADLRRLSAQMADVDGVVVALLAGGVEATDAEHHTRIAAIRAGLATLPARRWLLTVLPLSADAPTEVRRAVAAGWGLSDADVHPAAGSPDDAMVDAVLDGDPAPAGAVGPAEVVDALRRTHAPRAQRGFTVLFTGLSGSGKSTVANRLAVRLLELSDRSVLLLDGDRVRRNLSAGLGFGRADRITNVRRIGWVAAQVSSAGGIVVCAPIAPYDSTRREVRAMVEGASPRADFVLVHIATPLEECERRDRKGLYAKARAGTLPEFTGISDPYEPPDDADVVADTTGRSPDAVVDEVLEHLRKAGLLRL